jgi:hypothetical protein
MPPMRPHSPYFLIRISRQHQSEKQQKVGYIIIPETQRFMMYNVQAGEIVSIGKMAKEYFPEAEIGHTLLVHHFVQGESEHESREDHLVDQDETYNYYVVSAFAFHRKTNETYGIWDGEKIIPNKDYIFLDVPVVKEPTTPDEYINSAIQQSSGGIFTFTNWEESRETKADKMKRLKSEIQELSKSGAQKAHIAKGIKEKEAELEKLSVDINSKSYQQYNIAAFNQELKEALPNIEIGGNILILNLAAQTEMDFMGKKYIVAKTNYIGGSI